MKTIALAGNPNSGKTTLFNALTGSNQYVGNWPGVTVERKEARCEINGTEVTLTDLPGVYSLTPYSIEERITRNFIVDGVPDLVLNIVDATNIERNLYLTMQLMELERPMVIALNMADRFEAGVIEAAAEGLANQLHVPVVPVSAKSKMGIDEMFAAIDQRMEGPPPIQPAPSYDGDTQRAIMAIVRELQGWNGRPRAGKLAGGRGDGSAWSACASGKVPLMWRAMQLLEGEEEVESGNIPGVVREYERRGGADALNLVVAARYRYIGEVLDRVGFPREKGIDSVTERLDRIIMNRFLAFPIFIGAMGLMFAAAFGPLGNSVKGAVEGLIGCVGDGMGQVLAGAPEWTRSLLLDGVLAGVGGVISFLPQILIIFVFMAVMEDSGYMARAAFVTDRLLGKLGLSGRSFIPMLMGFGCTTTAVIAARGVENERDRRMTIMLTPFMSCGAKLPVYALISGIFFGNGAWLIALSLYALGVAVMVICGTILRKSVFREGESPFVMELPPYRLPTLKNVARRLWERARDFLTRAGTIIFAMSVLIWFLQSFTFDLSMVENPAHSIFGAMGAVLAPLFRPLGFGSWDKCVALLSGFVAKEAVVSTLQVLYSAADSAALSGMLLNSFTPASAYAFLVFVLLYTPCISALASMRRELGKGKYFKISVCGQLACAYVTALIFYRLGCAFM